MRTSREDLWVKVSAGILLVGLAIARWLHGGDGIIFWIVGGALLCMCVLWWTILAAGPNEDR